MEYKDLEKMTVVKLREEAAKLPGVEGVSGMKKDQLIALLCERLGIHRPEKKVAGLDKAAIKAHMRALKKKRAEALEAHDHKALKDIRRRLRVYRRSLRKHLVAER